ncbi:MAG: folE [Cyanobacteria bacterium RYN_339]|nr:folE [Cyanobacteria bacterium RYN_339]
MSLTVTMLQEPISTTEARHALRQVLRAIGDDPDREGLLDTPDRVIRSWAELFSGYNENPADILKTTFGDVEGYDEMVLLKDIPFQSTCEHHMLPFIGKAHVAYLPGERVVGLSKLARLVECFARRLQIQERLTREVAKAIMTHLQPAGCGVVIEAAHGCMSCRGIKKEGATMVTSTLEGDFKNPATRAEFLSLIRA